MENNWFHSLLPNTLVNKVRALFALALLMGATFFVFALVDASTMYKSWSQSRFHFLENSVQEWLSSYLDELHHTHLALKPRKATIAELIEDDNNRALQILLDEVRELHNLDFIFLDVESEILMNHTETLSAEEKSRILPILETKHKTPFLKAFDSKKMTELNRGYAQDGLVASLRVPIYFDAGDLAANLTIIKRIRASNSVNERREWMSHLSALEFVLPDRKRNVSNSLIHAFLLVNPTQ